MIKIKKTIKISLGIGAIIIITVISGFLAVATDTFLQAKTFKLVPFPIAIKTLLNGGTVLTFFALYELLFLCAIGIFFLQNKKSYQSELMAVTNDICIPKPAGQLQHGSARWLTENEKAKEFEVCKIYKDDKRIKELMKDDEVQDDE